MKVTVQSRRGRARAIAAHTQFDDESRTRGYVDVHDGPGPTGWFFEERIRAVLEILQAVPGGTLLEVGAGPGVLLRRIAERRPDAFRLVALDRSSSMVTEAAVQVSGAPHANVIRGDAEYLPLLSASCDAVLALGVIEYCDSDRVLSEIARVVAPGGLVVVSMLNPTSPYRLFEWCVQWPLGRLVRRVAHVCAPGWLGPPRDRTGLRAMTVRRLRRRLIDLGLQPVELTYIDAAFLPPPLDRKLSKNHDAPRGHLTLRSRSGFGLRRLGTAYLWVARRPDEEPRPGSRPYSDRHARTSAASF